MDAAWSKIKEKGEGAWNSLQEKEERLSNAIKARWERARERHITTGLLGEVNPDYVGGPAMSSLQMIKKAMKPGHSAEWEKSVHGRVRRWHNETIIGSLTGILGGSLYLGLKATRSGMDTLFGEQWKTAYKAGRALYERGKPREDAIKSLVAQLKTSMQTLQKEALTIFHK
ncbi:MAG: hypothetical protein G01um101433_49 [Parcubacteria group bacterium Gr01-1014_33]|nr:MAG: hypothetical protein G01um101433_49 [Parcubacteria group bacterium Gr01-1014_33]